MVREVRLCEHRDFRDIIQFAAETIDRPPQFVEKDYYATEALRIANDALGDHLIFKGGTSLSKGWNLLDRFSEDLFTVHAKIQELRDNARPLRRDARHYADLYIFSQQQPVLEMIGTAEYGDICADYDRVSREYFPGRYHPPPNLRFNQSEALVIPPDLLPSIVEDYDQQCALLFYVPPPPLAEVLSRLQLLAPNL